MQTIILAGGEGTRLGSKYRTIPKPMVKIGRKPIMWHIMKTYSHYGYDNFVVCIGINGDIIKDYFHNYHLYNSDIEVGTRYSETTYKNDHNEDWWVTVSNTGINTPKGGRIKKVERYLDDINMVTYGDSLCNVNIKELVEYHKSHDKIVTITAVHPPARFGEIVNHSFQEKPQTSKGYINGGYMVFNKELLDYLDEDSDFESDVLEELSKERQLEIYKHEGKWECMDHERDVVHLNKLWNNDNAFWKVW